MDMRTEDFGTSSAADIVGDGPQHSLRPAPEAVDWKVLHGRERDRAVAAEARCEDLRWREVRARHRTRSLETFLAKSRAKLDAAGEEIREVRRTAKRALAREREERVDPPEEARSCPCCGKPRVANGWHESEVVEIEAKVHRRRIFRSRWRRECECASAPSEVAVPPP